MKKGFKGRLRELDAFFILQDFLSFLSQGALSERRYCLPTETSGSLDFLLEAMADTTVDPGA